jgi:aminoglycoside phosphotransferase (APT) family kinase protein
MVTRMHDDEFDIDDELVLRLLTRQFPQWADRPLDRFNSSGTDNAIYRLGEDLAVRLPLMHRATGQVELELQWLPLLAPRLPLAIPAPLALGQPDLEYPFTWSVYRWLEGETADLAGLSDERQAATALGEFVTALHALDPVPGLATSGSGRGGSLMPADRYVRAAIVELDGIVDADAATHAWEAAINAPPWIGPPTLLHGDLHQGNLLMHRGRISAVIDFACLAVGDPACDSMVAWTFLTATSRDAFRAAHPVDDATWARARGRALSLGLVGLPYYRDTNPAFAAIARHAIREVLAETI